jgi:hypothetical protein
VHECRAVGRRDDALTAKHPRMGDTAQHVPLEEPVVDRQ